MKSIIFISLAVLVTVYADDKYTTENDNLDIEGVVNDLKSLKEFADCFNDNGNCNPVSGDFKKDLAEAIQQACSKCTDAQKHIFKVFLAGLQKKMPDEFEIFRQKYDPDNKYLAAVEAAVANS